jgi:hypothetical protein
MKKNGHVDELTQTLLEGLKTTLAGKLYGAYLYGAIAFPDTDTIHDIDFHVILTETLNERERHDLNGLHAALGEKYPTLGREMFKTKFLQSISCSQELWMIHGHCITSICELAIASSSMDLTQNRFFLPVPGKNLNAVSWASYDTLKTTFTNFPTTASSIFAD